MKLSQVLEAQAALAQLAGLKMPAHGAYKVSKNLRKLEPEIQSFEEARNKIVANYLEVKDGETVSDDAQKAADGEYKTLLEMEVSVEPHKIKLSDFGNAEVSAAQLLAIEFLLEE